MAGAFSIEIADRLATVTFDLPGQRVNILTTAVMEELEAVVAGLAREKNIDGAIFVSGKPGVFVAGADIAEIEALTDWKRAMELSERGQAVLASIEALPFATVAAIDGVCLGGGMELALACTYRVASLSDRTFFGLPETQLGIVPGFGGTQRLPRVVRLTEAIRMITTGARVFPGKALRTGLVNETVKKEHLVDAAGRWARKGRPPRGRRKPLRFDPVGFFLESNRVGRRVIFEKARQTIRRKVGDHYPAPLSALEAMEEGYRHGLDDGYAEEAHRLGTTAVSDVSKNLIRVFRLREHFGRVETAPAARIGRLGVLGAGVMGGGIAALGAEKGFRVRLVDMSTKALGMALKGLARGSARKRRKGVFTKTQERWVGSRMTYDTMLRGLGNAQVVIEAVAERMDVKRTVLSDLASKVPADTVIVSNTSSLSVSEMAASVAEPGRFAGMHFFNPVDRMELVEVVRGAETSGETIALVSGLARRLGKVPVVVADRPGFLVNRLLFAYLNEAVRLLELGLRVTEVDEVLVEFGMPMGAFHLLDVVGLDIATHAAANLHRGLGDRMKPARFIGVFEETGRLGRKSGNGFYRYNAGGEKKTDPDVERVLRRHTDKREKLEDEEIVNRVLLPMINEAALCLEESVVDHPGAIDLAMILGAGFPPFTGGLCRYADGVGIDRVVEGLRRLERDVDARFHPAALLVERAGEGRGLYEENEAAAPDASPDTG